MSELLSLLEFILNVGEIYKRYGIKGCLLTVLAIVALIAAVVVLALLLK
jgi:hypothetical protein